MGSLFNSAITGISAANAALSITSNNISNVNTPGYSRQYLIQSQAFSVNLGYGFVGNGVMLDDIERAYNKFLTEQSNITRSEASFYSEYNVRMQDLMNALGNSDTSVNAVLDNFYKNVQDFSLRPTEAATSMLTGADALAARMRSVTQQIQRNQFGANDLIESNVGKLNQIAKDIAYLNDQININRNGGINRLPNDLLDQRDQLVRNATELMGLSVSIQDDLTMNVFMSNGQPLVVGNIASEIKVTRNPTVPGGLSLGLNVKGGNIPLRSQDMKGGEIAALMNYRDNELKTSQDELGKITIALVAAYNKQQQFGIDSSGNPGQPLFSLSPPTVQYKVGNDGQPASVNVFLGDTRDLQPTNYRLVHDSTLLPAPFRVFDDLTGQDLTSQVVWDGSTPPIGTLNGVRFQVDPAGAPPMQDGDTIILDHTSQAGLGLKVLIDNPRLLTHAAPMQTNTSVGNAGTGVAGSLRSTSVTPPDYATSIEVRFSSNNGDYELFDISVNPPVTTGVTGNLFTNNGIIAYNGWEFEIQGSPQTGDSFSVVANDPSLTDLSGDNRNALAFAQLASANLIGNRTLTGTYANMVSYIGNRAQEVSVGSTAATYAYNQSNVAELSYSGVNLDEEAANLLRFQQAYNASSKVLATASQLFDSILAAIN